MHVLDDFINDRCIYSAGYFYNAIGYVSSSILSIYRNRECHLHKIKLETIIIKIRKMLDHNNNLESEIIDYFDENEPYYHYILSKNVITIEYLIFGYLLDLIDHRRFLGGDFEILQDKIANRYGISKIEQDSIFNHQGVFLKDKFYYYNRIINPYRNNNDIPKIIKLLNELHMELNNQIYVRLDENLAISSDVYKPFKFSFSELYQGVSINLDQIDFPFYKSNVTLVIYNPNTMKKIQFKLSSRKDNEKWIEVEELFSLSDRKWSMTRYLHSIYCEDSKSFNHIDGSVNFYELNTYKMRLNTTINAHSDRHTKLWLVEGNINIKYWTLLIYNFFDDDDLISDAFSGKLSIEILEDIIEEKHN